MLLPVALFALFMMGFWLYCLTDAMFTPAEQCRGLRKPTWVAVIAGTFIGGAVAWLIVRRPRADSSVPLLPLARRGPADDGVQESTRHPAGRARMADAVLGAPGPEDDTAPDDTAPKGPDDDTEFLRALDRAIRRDPPVG